MGAGRGGGVSDRCTGAGQQDVTQGTMNWPLWKVKEVEGDHRLTQLPTDRRHTCHNVHHPTPLNSVVTGTVG